MCARELCGTESPGYMGISITSHHDCRTRLSLRRMVTNLELNISSVMTYLLCYLYIGLSLHQAQTQTRTGLQWPCTAPVLKSPNPRLF